MKLTNKGPMINPARYLAVWCLALMLWMTAGMAQAQSQPVGQVTHLSGLLTVRHADGSRKALAVKSAILQGDTLITEASTYARVKFVDDAEVVLRPGSEVAVSKYVYDEKKPENDSVAIGLVKGGLRAVTGLVGKRNHEAVNFGTPTATIGIRGTIFVAIVCEADCSGIAGINGQAAAPGLYVQVFDGKINVANGAGQQDFSAGQFGYAGLGAPPVIVPNNPGMVFSPPPSFSSSSGGFGSGTIGKSNAPVCVVQ